MGNGYTVQSGPCLWSDNTVRDQAASTLERTHRRLRLGAEVPIDRYPNLSLHLFDQFTA